MPSGIFEGSPWLDDTVEFTRMPVNNIARIPSEIHEREPMLIGASGDVACSGLKAWTPFEHGLAGRVEGRHKVAVPPRGGRT
jgi:hypothetical protein